MSQHRLLGVLVLICVLLSVWFVATPVDAGQWFPFFKDNSVRHPPSWVGNPQRHVAAPPGPHRYSEYNNAVGPWYGYGFGVPTYQWGYFGARYRPAVISHKGYYGDSSQWSYRRGY